MDLLILQLFLLKIIHIKFKGQMENWLEIH